MRKKICELRVILFFIVTMISCKNDEKKTFDYNEYCKMLRISKTVVTTYPSKFGKIDYTNGFVSEIHTYDTNGIIIKEEMFYNDEFLDRKFNTTTVRLFTNNFGICRIETYNYKNELSSIYIDSLINKKTVERKIYDVNNQLVNLVRYKYSGDKLTETVMYDGKGKIESKELSIYESDKHGKTLRYDANGNIIETTTADFYDNYTLRKITDKEGKMTYKSKTEFVNGLQVTDYYTYYDPKDNDSTIHKDEYTYQDSLFYKQILKYKNNEIESAKVYTNYKRE